MPELLSRLNLHHLQVFRAVAHRLSYSRAAADLHISQPAVSRYVGALERELRVELLGQAGNRVYLTDVGRTVLAYADRIVELTRETQRALVESVGLDRGHLRLGASNTPGVYLLPEAVAEFRERHPGVELELRLGNSQEIEEAVLRGDLDAGFVGARFRPELQVRPYVRDELALIVPPDHRFVEKEAIDAAELAEVCMVVREPGSGTRQVLTNELARLGVSPGRLFELNGCEAVKRAVMAGIGVAVVSCLSLSLELRCGVLRTVAAPELALARDLHIVTRKDVRPSVAALAFLSLVQKRPRES